MPTSNKKGKNANRSYARALRSNSCEDDPSSNRTTPDHNKFDILASDDDSVPSKSAKDTQISELASSIMNMNTSINKIFGVLSHHSTMLNDRNVPNSLQQPVSDQVPHSTTNVPNNTNRTHPTPDPDLDNPDTISYKDYPDGDHDYDLLPSKISPDVKTSIDVKPPTTTSSSNLPIPAPSVPITSEPPATTLETEPIFGQNAFSIIVSSASKIKYMSMESYLKDKTVASDSVRDIEKMYVDILMSLTFIFEMDLSFLPPFGGLGRDIDFESIFLRNLHGFTKQKCKSIFLRIGTILKSHLTSSNYISDKRCPKTSIVIRANPIATGWSLLEQILCDRLVICGGIPDYDLDAIRTSLAIQPRESYVDFYVRTQNLLNEYDLCYRNKTFVPTTKIMQTFLSELNRAPEYVPFLTIYYNQLISHISTFGDVDNSYHMDFTIHDVYRNLQMMHAPMIPSTLRPSSSSIPSKVSHASPPITTTDNSQNSYQEFIACLEVTIDEDCSDPTICSQQTSNRSRCQACLLGFHREVDCFLRGPSFQPAALKRRIKIYNEVNGDNPPENHKLREYNPQGKAADHNKSTLKPAIKKDNRDSFRPNRNHKPFANFNNKSNGRNPNINAFDDNPPIDDQDDIDPTITSFITSQSDYIYDNTTNDDNDPTICSIMSLSHLPSSSDNHHMSSAQQNTPSSLIKIINDHHIRTNTRPSKKFMQHHSKSLEKLPITYFEHYSTASFHVDGGANCGAVNDQRLFYFYIKTATPIEQVGGSHLHSPGWGGILINIDNNIHLLAPVYHCPDNPRNTLSTTSLVQYCSYKSAIVNTNKYLEIVDTRSITSRINFDVKNDLDYVTLSIMSLKKHNSHSPPLIASATLRRSPRLAMQAESTNITHHDPDIVDHPNIDTSTRDTSITVPEQLLPRQLPHILESTKRQQEYDIIIDDTVVTSLPRSVVAKIAAFTVLLAPPTSPRDEVIKTMNSLLGNYLNSTESSTHQIEQHPTCHEQMIIPIIAKFSKSVNRKSDPLHDWIRVHFGLLHNSQSTLDPIIKNNLLEDIPISLKQNHPPLCTCFICAKDKAIKRNRGPPVDKSHLRPFERLHLDFSFFGVTSIRGFTSALDITCGATSYTLGFPGKAKTPPIDTVRWVINTIRTMGYTVLFIRVDEDSSLANSSEFCTLIQSLNCLLETTGGGNSTNNGMVESGNRPKANMVRSILSTMNIIFGQHLEPPLKIEQFWCFAYQHTCFIQRRLYNRLRKDIPYVLVHGKRPSILECIIPGSILTIVDPNKNLKKKLDPTCTSRGYFLGFSNHTNVRLYFDPLHPTKIKRSVHCIVEDMATISLLMKALALPSLSPDLPTEIPSTITSSLVEHEDLPIRNNAFPPEDIFSITLTLPIYPNPIGMTIIDDPLFNIPVLKSCSNGSYIHSALPPGRRCNHFIVGIGSESPITGTFAKQILHMAQQTSDRQITLDLIRRDDDRSTTLSITRSMFDQLPSVLHNRPLIASQLHHIPDTHEHFITAPSKPSKPKTIFEAFKSPFRHNWKAAAWNQFKKNHKIAVFSIPFPQSDLPTDARVFHSQLIPEIKNTDVPGIFELKVRDVIVGTPQIKKIDFDDSYAPTIDPVTIKIHLTMACGRGYITAIIDVKNAFQNTIASPAQRIYVSASKLYLEWASTTFGTTFDKNEKYFRQMFNSNQGTKDAGNLWYTLIKDIITKYGLVRCTVDHAYFVKQLEDGSFMLVSLATDDLLVSCRTYQIFNDFVLYLQQYFEVTVQDGQVLKFLGLRIIQSNDCLSIDQGEYTFEFLEHYFGSAVDRVKTLSSPMRYDSDFEKDLVNALPLSPTQLQIVCIKYKGSYRFWTGKFIHLCTQTRPDISYATQRLSEFNNSPTELAFECIVRVLRYLAGDVLRPIVYPRKSFDGYTKVTWFATPESKFEIDVPNKPCLFADAELARCIATRRTYYCVIITVFNVFILMKIRKTTTIMQHTTDAEMKASYDGVRHLLPIRQIFAFSGLPLRDPSKMYTDNAAVHAIIDSKRMTPRCRHLDIPIAFLHQEKDKSYQLDLCRTLVMLADMGTKPHSPQLQKLFKYWASGTQYLPDPDTEHYRLLQMEYYETNYADILKLLRRATD